jgi:hypothetical protein
MYAITTRDGFVYWQQSDGTYTDGDSTYTEAEIASNGRDS